MISAGYFDTYDAATQADLSVYTDVYTFGRKTKNDGGGAHYKRYVTRPPHLSFQDIASPRTFWGLIPDGGTVNPLQAGGGGGDASDLDALQTCIDFIQWWNETTTENTSTTPPASLAQGKDSNRFAIKLVIPANRTFVVNTQGTGLLIRAPITIEGEDRLTSVIMMQEASVGSAIPIGDGFDVDGGSSSYSDLFHAEGDPTSNTDPTPKTIRGLTLRNFTVKGSYAKVDKDDHGSVRLFSFKNLERVLFEDMVFTRNRAVMIAGDGVRGLTMRGCLLSENRRGGMVISGAADITVENNDFRWVADDPIAINASGPVGTGTDFSPFYKYGASIRIVGNRSLSSRGLNVIGAKNVLIESNISNLGHGRAIHVGVVTDEGKGDTTTLNIIVRSNIVLDLLAANIDPQFDQTGDGGHRAIDIELLNGAPGAPPPPNFIPGLPNGTQIVADPTQYHYTVGQGGGTLPAPHAANLLIEGNIVARTRPPALPDHKPNGQVNPDHIAGFDNFQSYGLGKYGGDEIGVVTVQVPLAGITPTEGIAVSGAARGLTIRGNQIGGCDTAIFVQGWGTDAPPLGLYDVVIEQNDLTDWTTAGIWFSRFGSQQQRVSILGNRANGDPFHRNQLGTVRLNGGAWANGAALGCFIDASGLGVAMISGNHARNVSQLIVGYLETLHTMQDNVGYCDPAKVEIWDAANRGIGVLIRPQLGWRYMIEGSDPGNLAQYGSVLNHCPLARPTIPTTGKWVEGTFVRCSATTPTTKTSGGLIFEITGWRRITTDSNNAIGANWQQQWALTGT